MMDTCSSLERSRANWGIISVSFWVTLVVSRDVQPKSWTGLTCSSVYSPWQDYNSQWRSSTVWVMSLKSVTAQSGTKRSSCTFSCVWWKIVKAAIFSLPLIFCCTPRSFSGFLLLLPVCRVDIPIMLSADLSQDQPIKVNNYGKFKGWNSRYIRAQHSLWGKGTSTNLTVPLMPAAKDRQLWKVMTPAYLHLCLQEQNWPRNPLLFFSPDQI